MRWSLPVVLVATLGAVLSPAAPVAAHATAGPQIVAVYPNPTYDGDRGDFVVLEIPQGTTGALSLSDGATVVVLPDRRPSGRVAVATELVARNLTELPVVLVSDPFRLANRGETVTLRLDGRAVQSVTYARAPEGSIYRAGTDGWHWQRLGGTPFPVRTAEDARARLFVLPDAPEAALEPLRTAERRLWLGAYMLTSAPVVDALCEASARGVDVRALVERDPVGGMTATGAARLDRLVDCGVAVRVIGGPRAR